MASLFGGPSADPLTPGTVAPEPGRDLTVVGGQVVLGEQVDDHRGLRDGIERRIARLPILATEEGEVAPATPRHVIVRLPILRNAKVALDIGRYDWFELVQQSGLQGVRRGHLVSPVGVIELPTYATVTFTIDRRIGGLPSRTVPTESYVSRLLHVACWQILRTSPGATRLLMPPRGRRLRRRVTAPRGAGHLMREWVFSCRKSAADVVF